MKTSKTHIQQIQQTNSNHRDRKDGFPHDLPLPQFETTNQHIRAWKTLDETTAKQKHKTKPQNATQQKQHLLAKTRYHRTFYSWAMPSESSICTQRHNQFINGVTLSKNIKQYNNNMQNTQHNTSNKTIQLIESIFVATSRNGMQQIE